jgi:23S rRNA G2445 N2-methylase RlmL
VVGVDLSPEYISHARELATNKTVSGNVEFKVGDMRAIKAVLKDDIGR